MTAPGPPVMWVCAGPDHHVVNRPGRERAFQFGTGRECAAEGCEAGTWGYWPEQVETVLDFFDAHSE